MKRIDFTATQIIIESQRPYEQVIQAIEKRVGRVDYTLLEEIIETQQPLEKVAESFVGSSTFMYLAKIDQGRILSLSGEKKKCSLYVLGNPLLGNRIHNVSTAAGLYIPFRLCAYEDSRGTTYVSYDLPSSLVAHFNNERITQLALQFDQQLEALALSVAGVQAD